MIYLKRFTQTFLARSFVFTRPALTLSYRPAFCFANTTHNGGERDHRLSDKKTGFTKNVNEEFYDKLKEEDKTKGDTMDSASGKYNVDEAEQYADDKRQGNKGVSVDTSTKSKGESKGIKETRDRERDQSKVVSTRGPNERTENLTPKNKEGKGMDRHTEDRELDRSHMDDLGKVTEDYKATKANGQQVKILNHQIKINKLV